MSCWGDPKMGMILVPEGVKQNVISSAAGVEHTCAVSLKVGGSSNGSNGSGEGVRLKASKGMSMGQKYKDGESDKESRYFDEYDGKIEKENGSD